MQDNIVITKIVLTPQNATIIITIKENRTRHPGFGEVKAVGVIFV